MAGLCLVVLGMTTGCAVLNDDEVRPELGAGERAEAQQTSIREMRWPGTDAVHRIDGAWTDSCGNAAAAGFFQPASGTRCRIDAGAVYTIDGTGGSGRFDDAVRVAASALREGGRTDQDLAAQTIGPDGTVRALVDDGGHRSVELGDGLGQDRFAVVEVAGWDGSLGTEVDPERTVVASSAGRGVAGRIAAVRASGATAVLVVTDSADYFTSWDNVPPPVRTRPAVPPCYSGSNDCVGG